MDFEGFTALRIRCCTVERSLVGFLDGVDYKGTILNGRPARFNSFENRIVVDIAIAVVVIAFGVPSRKVVKNKYTKWNRTERL